MKENMLDVLMYLFEHYMDEEIDEEPDQESIKIKLIQAGFPQVEINKAFSWLEGLSQQQRNDDKKTTAPDQFSMRLFTPQEIKRLDTECRGFLLFLEQMAVLNPVTRELVIDRAMALEMGGLDLEKLKWVILMVLLNQPGQEAAYAWIEDLVFEEMNTNVH